MCAKKTTLSYSEDSGSLKNDILGWDVYNWNKALMYFDRILNDRGFNFIEKSCLEIGSGFNGGLSLWLAQKGAHVHCTSYNDNYCDASPQTKKIHKEYGVNDLISYGQLDIRKLNKDLKYDVIALKSVLGGVDRSDDYLVTVKEIVVLMYESLKPGGVLLITENLVATILHDYLRGSFGSGKNGWKYFSYADFNRLFIEYDHLVDSYGVMGCLGRNENQRGLLGKFDSLLEWIIPKRYCYIGTSVVFKGTNEH